MRPWLVVICSPHMLKQGLLIRPWIWQDMIDEEEYALIKALKAGFLSEGAVLRIPDQQERSTGAAQCPQQNHNLSGKFERDFVQSQGPRPGKRFVSAYFCFGGNR